MRVEFAWAAFASVLTVALARSPLRGSGECDPSNWQLPVDGVYRTKGAVDPHKLNVHLIPHSHDDPGWLASVDQYYMENVQYILDTTVQELMENPDRQFMFVEQAFFQRWWGEQGSKTKAVVRELVAQGRLDLSVNGGWVMHDEATPHYAAMVDQTAYGHRLLRDEFNVTPRIGWQIDPFGHSATHGSLLSAGVGFDALYFARIDYQDYAARKAAQDLEFVWRSSKSRGAHSQVFTGEIIDHYGPPHAFDYYFRANFVQDDPALHDFNVCAVVDGFVAMALERGASTKGTHVFVPMGGDFQYDDARVWFKNMDKLLHYVNQDARVSVLYSNLSYYTDLKLAEGLAWTVKTDDFFPYGTAKHAYWTGYFTSRPALKRFARVANVLLQQVRQLDATYKSHFLTRLDTLERAVGLVQHHDGLSGTERQSIADDYALRLHGGVLDGLKEVNEVLFVVGEKGAYEFCLQANISVCDVSASHKQFEVLVHNALPRTSVHTVSIPVLHKTMTIKALSASANVRHQEVVHALPVHAKQAAAPYSLVFSTELGPLSDARFLVAETDQLETTPTLASPVDSAATEITLENELVRAKIDSETGSLVSITNKARNIELPVTLAFGYYQAFQDPSDQCSGAYVFRPDSKTVHPVARAGDVTRLDLHASPRPGRRASRVAFRVGEWVSVEYRLSDSDEFVEVEWTVGSVPVHDKLGKEVVVRFDTQGCVQSNQTLFTDSNGLEFVARVRSHRETWNLTLHDDQEFVAANYFPITTGAYIKDAKHQLNIVTDRAQGAASLQDGQVEVMVHRRLLADDGKGVGENLNETESFYNTETMNQSTRGLIVRGSFFVNIDSAAEGMRSLRAKMEKQFFTPLVAFRKPVPASGGGKVPWLTVNEFPENVGLTTLEARSASCVMVRLTHLYAIDEHATLSQPARVDFAKLFAVRNGAISEAIELLLTGVAPLASRGREAHSMKWKTIEPIGVNGERSSKPMPSSPLTGTVVELQAMEVRTFQICFSAATAEQHAAESTAADEDVVASVTDFLQDAKEKAIEVTKAFGSRVAALDEVVALE
ncbi:hypothetical protein PybrP1_003372 [[Pythium] brassicae (nom. inval.)]|nr:hypothetical protein PybrP1_003372 [[Pythium] brassicae (nom. inval.)]